MLMERNRSCLILVDFQEKLIPAMAEIDAALTQTKRLVAAARRLGLPILVTQQYPQGLGATDADLRAALGNAAQIFDKIEFSGVANPSIRAALQTLGRDQAVIAGIEAHICVLQTALRLSEIGQTPFVVADAVSSRRSESKRLALERMAQDGVRVVSTEMVLFEWLGAAGSDAFKDISRLIR